MHLTDPHRHGLRPADIGDDVPLPFQPHLQQANDPIVLELLAHRANEDWTH